MNISKVLVFLSVIVNLAASMSRAETLSVIPKPLKAEFKEGNFTLKPDTIIIAGKSLDSEARLLFESVKETCGFQLRILHKDKSSQNVIILRLDKSQSNLGKEGYHLSIQSDKIIIIGSTAAGVFYGCQTLRQMLPLINNNGAGCNVQSYEITDAPRFPWRGYLLDEARHFKGKKAVKRILDQMALLKMNVFQWHLTDDQGWRLEIKKYPKLTKIGSHRQDTQIGGWSSPKRSGKPHSGYYSQDEVREIIQYAADRHITIIPEIEMPGHASSAIAAYPEVGVLRRQIDVPVKFGKLPDSFNPVDDYTFTFLTDILSEVTALFPSQIIHIGGDEVVFASWKRSKEVQEFMKKRGLDNVADVQTHFTNRISQFIESKGRRMMGWNEIMGHDLHGFLNNEHAAKKTKLAKGSIIHFWKGNIDLARTAVTAGHDIVNSHHVYTYLDYGYNKISLKKAYSFDPIPTGLQEKHHDKVLGLCCNMWSEWIPREEDLHRQTFPRIAAYAEVGWTAKERKYYTEFAARMKDMLKRWDIHNISYARINLETDK